MSNLKKYRQNLEGAKAIKAVTEALQETAYIKLKTIRDSTLRNVLFFQEISNLYHAIRVIATRRKILDKDLKILNKNSKTISILITSNHHLQGDTEKHLSEVFKASTSKYPTDRLVIGKFGARYLSAFSNFTFQPFFLKSELPSPDELKTLSKIAVIYSKVLVFHPKFETVVRQTPTITDISQSNVESEVLDYKIDYILEPEIHKMLEFFENQIMALMLQAIFLQTNLSFTASRMISMYSASNNADVEVNHQKTLLLKAFHSLADKQTMEMYSVFRRRYG